MAIIGQPFKTISGTSGQGIAYVFRRTGSGAGDWTEEGELNSSSRITNGHFGISVAINDQFALVGAPGEEFTDEEADAGATYTFRRDCPDTDDWGQVARFLPMADPEDHEDGDTFGAAVGIASDDLIIVGAPKRNEGATPLSNSGAAFLFEDPPFCDCDADVDNSGCVDVDDLVDVVLAWGDCGSPCPPCAEDTNGDCTVNVDDLVAVVISWGPCPDETCSPTSLSDEIDDAGLTNADWEEFLDNIDDENYRCWMDHYLSSCHPTCTSPPSCPDDDPWDNH